MNEQQVNALAIRFKSITLLLFRTGLMEIEELNKGIEGVSNLFDDGFYDQAQTLLEIIEEIVVDILDEH